ncbi:unnamed protein product [Moneuplotes crassus]|uniref:Uncharacterized protein n=1 Tax=Euplotes crassus TaxID=5936 RepID=A0AAD1UN54_EUPCR|nr:unnamed protein product [Moneuplotes crassus]
MNSQRRMHGPIQQETQLKNRMDVSGNFHRDRNRSIGKAIKITESFKTNRGSKFPEPQKYSKPTIFDPEKAELIKQGYREGQKDNPNKIINNNTQFRIFNEISPKDKNIAPLENMNDNPNKWKPKMTYYLRENQGDITQTKNDSGKNFSPSGIRDRSRDARIANSKRKLQNYMNLVNTDLRKMNKKYQERMVSRSAMTKLPEHTQESYAVREMARNGPTNKTVMNINKFYQSSNTDNFHKNKYSVPSYPVLDIQQKKVINKECNIDARRSRRSNTLDQGVHQRRSDDNYQKEVVSPSNPHPQKFQRNVSKLQLNDHNNFDKVGSVTYRDNNSKAVYPLNQNTNVNKQISSVFERNKKSMKSKYPAISPVFKPTIPTKVDIEKNPLKILDTANHEAASRRNPHGIIYKSSKTPEFTDILSMSRKLDFAAHLGK